MNRIIEELMAAARGRRTDGDESATEDWGAIRQHLDQVREKAEQFVASRPAICLGAAVVAGIALGWWVKRK